MTHSDPARRNPFVSGFRAARTPVTAVAMLAILGTTVGQAQNSDGNIIAASGESSETRSADPDSPDLSANEQPPVSEDTVIMPVVNYYKQACPSFDAMIGVSDKVSIIAENSIGQGFEESKETHAAGVSDIAESLRAASDTLKGISSPDNLPGSSDTSRATYDTAVIAVSEQSALLTDDLVPLSDQLRESDSSERLSEVVSSYRLLVDEQVPALTSSLNDLVAVAGPSTSATGAEVRRLPECSSVFVPSPQPGDSDVVPAAVDLHVRLIQAKNMTEASFEKISNVVDDTAGLSIDDGKVAIIKTWRDRAEVAQRAMDLLHGWEAPETLSAAEANATAGYVEHRDDAARVYETVRDLANAAADIIAAAGGSTPVEELSSLNAALTEAMTVTSESLNEETKLAVRTARNAPIPTSATADEIQRIVAENPVP